MHEKVAIVIAHDKGQGFGNVVTGLLTQLHSAGSSAEAETGPWSLVPGPWSSALDLLVVWPLGFIQEGGHGSCQVFEGIDPELAPRHLLCILLSKQA